MNLINQLREATKEAIMARRDLTEIALMRIDAEGKVHTERNMVVLNDAEYALLPNAERRAAYLDNKLACYTEEVTKLEARRIVAQNKLDIADATIRCVKYTVLAMRSMSLADL
jgi:hypothetical protein